MTAPAPAPAPVTRPGEGAVSLRMIADRAGVSKATVSLALNQHPRISKARREQIREIADQLGYRPNAAATALAYRKWDKAVTEIVGVIAWINTWSDPARLRSFREFDGYWRGAERTAAARGYRLEEFAVGPGLTVRQLNRILISRGIPAILLPPQERPADLSGLSLERLAVVKFGRSIPFPVADMVAHNHAYDVIAAAGNLRALGYKRIGMITSENLRRVTLFDVGMMKAQQAWPATQRLPILVLPPDGGPAAPAKIRRWIVQHRPDVVLTTEGRMHAWLREAGYRVPEDLALAATSISDCDADSGIYQNAEEIGRVAAESVISMLHHGRFGLPAFPQEILVRGRWIQGAMLPAVAGAGA